MRSEPEVPPAPSGAVRRLRLACAALALTLLTFSQSSGLEAADTKLDLVVSPARFMEKALTMWDPTAAAGQLQDQAYGYLFPMGPFYLLGKLSALSPWVVQRSWESALLVAAFLGLVRLSRLLGVPGFWPRIGASLAYALAPRMLMELGVISSELLPVAVLPWVLIPLVRGASGGSPRRAAARSGVALLFASGINAAATLAILPVPALWLITRTSGPRRRALASWWVIAIGLASLWWALPLLVLGKYSPPFLDWIESSAVTTSQTSLVQALRGVDHWQAYLGPNVWPSGWILAVAPAAILATAALAALGLAGVARRATPQRMFLTSVLVVGLVLVTLGHVATIEAPFAGSVRHLLDGVLVPFRNVHKFDPVVRLPIAIGIGHALAALARRVPARSVLFRNRTPVGVYPRVLVLVAVLGIGATAISPALSGRIVPQTRTVSDPSWWAQTGSWLGRHEAAGRALVVPGAAQPSYVWGQPRDDALQPVADGPWTVRDAAPLTQPGYIRLLDSIEATLAAGHGDATLAPVLARSGIRYLIVRNDLDTGASGTTALRFVHATISNSSGLTLAASFGPSLHPPDDPSRLIDLGLTRAGGAVQVYENTRWRAEASLLPAAGTVVSNGSSDQLPQLVADGISSRTPIVLGAEPAALRDAHVSTTTVLTEGTRKREFGFGGVDRYSATMTESQPFVADRAVHDYLPDGSSHLSVIKYTGISGLETSSAASAAQSAWAAVDGDSNTSWVSASVGGPIGQWIQIELPRAIDVSSIQIAFAAGRSAYPTQLRVTTDAGAVVDDVSPDSNVQPLQLPPGAARSIRLTITKMSANRRGVGAALATITVPGVLPSRSLLVPSSGDPAVVSFAVLPGARTGCLTVSGAAACDPSWAAGGEEDTAVDRTFSTTHGDSYRGTVGVRLRPGTQLNNLLDSGNPVRALASSVDSTDPRERAGAALDGDPTTGWVAKTGDRLPALQLALPGARRLTGITVQPIKNAPVTTPTRVLITAENATFAATVPADGRIVFPHAIRSDSIRIAVVASSLRVTSDSATGGRRFLPVGIGEITLLGGGVPTPTVPSELDVPCAAGPIMLLDGASVSLHVTADARQALAGDTVTAQVCGRSAVRLPAGENRIRVAADGLFSPQTITLRRTSLAAAVAAPAGKLHVLSWGSTSRSVRVTAGATAFLSVTENANAGWSATLLGHALPAVTLDGWHQGWLLPAGSAGVVHLEFTPERAVDWGIVAGVIAVLVLLVTAFARPRRQRAIAATASPPIAAAAVRRPVVLLLGTVGLGAVGGMAGVVVFAGTVLVRDEWHRRGRSAVARRGVVLPRGHVAIVGFAAVLIAGLAEAFRPANAARPLANASLVQLLCLVAIAAVVAGLLTPLPARAPRPGVPAQQRPLDEVVRQGRGRGRRGRGEQEQRHEVAPEDGPPQATLQEDQNR